MMKKVINSPIRWAGSKKKLLNEMIEIFDKNSKIYIEPFLGSGVVLLNILNNKEYFNFEKYYVNDINCNIINFFNLLKEDYKYVIKNINKLILDYNSLNDLKLQEEFYYNIRKKYNSTKSKIKTVYFVFLMKAGFNGVYRENSKGVFNVPFGKKEKIIIDTKLLEEISNKIQNVEFYNMDYHKFIDELIKNKKIVNAFIYFDPPYLPEENNINQKQTLYTKSQFNHREFVDYIEKLKNVKIEISMINSEESNRIYANFNKNKLKDIIRTINPKKIFKSTEIIYSNFKIF